MNLAWTLKNGACCMSRIEPAELPARLKRLHRRRLESVAWTDGQRDTPSGAVEQTPEGRWVWWYYDPDTKATTTTPATEGDQ